MAEAALAAAAAGQAASAAATFTALASAGLISVYGYLDKTLPPVGPPGVKKLATPTASTQHRQICEIIQKAIARGDIKGSDGRITDEGHNQLLREMGPMARSLGVPESEIGAVMTECIRKHIAATGDTFENAVLQTRYSQAPAAPVAPAPAPAPTPEPAPAAPAAPAVAPVAVDIPAPPTPAPEPAPAPAPEPAPEPTPAPAPEPTPAAPEPAPAPEPEPAPVAVPVPLPSAPAAEPTPGAVPVPLPSAPAAEPPVFDIDEPAPPAALPSEPSSVPGPPRGKRNAFHVPVKSSTDLKVRKEWLTMGKELPAKFVPDVGPTPQEKIAAIQADVAARKAAEAAEPSLTFKPTIELKKPGRLPPGGTSQIAENGHTWQRSAAVADGNCFYDAFLYATDEAHRSKTLPDRAVAAAAFRQNVRANREAIIDRLSDAFAVAGEAARVTDAADLRRIFDEETRDTEYTSIQLAMAIARWKGYRLVVIDGDQFAASSSVIVPAGTSDLPETGVPTATLSYIAGYRHFEPVSIDGRFIVPGEEYPGGMVILLEETQQFEPGAITRAPPAAVAPAVAPKPGRKLLDYLFGPKTSPEESPAAPLDYGDLFSPEEVADFKKENPFKPGVRKPVTVERANPKVKESLGTYRNKRAGDEVNKTRRNRPPKDKPSAAPEGEPTPEQEADLARIVEEVKATTSPGGLQPVDLVTKERTDALIDRALRSLPADITDRRLRQLYRKFSRELAQRGVTVVTPEQFAGMPPTIKTMFKATDAGGYELVDEATYAARVDAEIRRRATASVPVGLGAPLPGSTVPGAEIGNPILVAAEAAAAEAPVRPSLPPLVSDPRARASTVKRRIIAPEPAEGGRLRKKTFKSRRGKKTNVRGTRRRKDRANRAHKNSRRGA